MYDWESLWNSKGLELPWIVNSPEKNLLQFFNEYNELPKNTLDVGCGHGYHSSIISKYSNVTGIDISETAIEYAKRLYPTIKFECADILEFEVNTKFDLIYDKGCFHHLDTNISMSRYMFKISNLLSKDSYWLCIAGKKYDELMDFKLPRNSLKRYIEMVEPF
ncbi:class I SAM-dependent methyltransferase, partial [bacterium]|nr:class I SAM-dependent methyltransferase [bacterium]